MKKQECVAMLLAGGEGKRLGALTSNLAKPAVHFGGKYRIIDFSLSNCANSGVEAVGVLTQYQTMTLHSHIGSGSTWDLDRRDGGIAILPPYADQQGGSWYCGTANAVYQNIPYIEQFNPDYVLVISGDHIYNMDYRKMLDFHKREAADVTISGITVKWEEACRFGIMSTDSNRRITRFTEKPAKPDSNLASMGIYIFNWDILKAYLINDNANEKSSHDFGSDIIPTMLYRDVQLSAYPYEGYWKDVGTIDSLWEAHMDMLSNDSQIFASQKDWPIYSMHACQPPQFIAASAQVNNSILNEGCSVYGKVGHSVLFHGVTVGEGSKVMDSVVMPNVKIGKNTTIHRAIIGANAVIEDGEVIGSLGGYEVTVIGEHWKAGKQDKKVNSLLLHTNSVRLERIG